MTLQHFSASSAPFTLSVLVWLPLALALVVNALPAKHVGKAAAVASLLPVAVAITFVANFNTHNPGLQFVTDRVWISALGIHYKLGINGLNLTLMLLTTVLFTVSLAWSAMREVDRPHTYYFWFGLAESAVLGAFLAQDLMLFVAFFDLMLIPFYFLVGSWGTGERVRATIKMVIYTMVGSFLMLAAAVATGVIASGDHGTGLNFTFSALQHLPLSRTDEDWIFLAFALAFLVKMPIAPFHGWLADAYKAMPIPAVAVFSGVVAKVASYGFLQIVLPLFPHAAHHYQVLMLIIALVSIMWATAMAFTTGDSRLVIAYSSVAQMGFILLGIFSLDPQGGQGALLQMLNHGVVTAASFFVVAAAAARAGGSERLEDMGGIAFKAPVLASLFLIITLANLAMPGSSNFIGEFMILLGAFNSHMAIALIASAAVVGASFYALRLFIRAMHNRVGGRVHSIEIRRSEAIALVPLCLIILALAFFPQFGLSKSETSMKVAVLPAASLGGHLDALQYNASAGTPHWNYPPLSEAAYSPRAKPRRVYTYAKPSTHPKTVPLASPLILATAHVKGPHIDWAELSPFVVLAVGALVVLLVGLVGKAQLRSRFIPALSLLTLAGAAGTEIWRFTHTETIIAGALRVDDLALIVDLVCAASAAAAVLMSLRAAAPREAGHGEFHGLLLFSVMGMAVLISAQDLVTLFLGLELLSIPLYILCAAEYRREGSLESGLKYLIIGSVGSATLLYGLAMIYGATGQTGFDQIAGVLATGGPSGNLLGDPLLLSGIALVVVGFAFKASVAPFHQWTPDVYEGAPTAITAFMATATKAAALAVFLRFFDVALIADQAKWAPALAALATATMLIGNVGALGQTSLKRLLGYSGVGQAGYMLSGVVVGTRLGVSATIFYVVAYLFMNIAAFAVVQHQEAEVGDDQIGGLAGLGKRAPVLAWSITIAMLALAGIPGTVGFIGKFRLIDALVNGGYGWLAIVLVVGAMISLGYYLRVVAAVWMSPESSRGSAPAQAAIAPIAGGSQEADKLPYPEMVGVATLFAAATIFFGIIPGPLFHFAAHAGAALTGLF